MNNTLSGALRELVAKWRVDDFPIPYEGAEDWAKHRQRLDCADELEAALAAQPDVAPHAEAVNENIAADSYWAIADYLGTPSGWSVQEHVWEQRELLQECIFALGKMGANADLKHPQRDLWERLQASLKWRKEAAAPTPAAQPDVGGDKPFFIAREDRSQTRGHNGRGGDERPHLPPFKPAPTPAAVGQGEAVVYEVSNKTTGILFANRADAEAFAASGGATAGLNVSSRRVMGGTHPCAVREVDDAGIADLLEAIASNRGINVIREKAAALARDGVEGGA